VAEKNLKRIMAEIVDQITFTTDQIFLIGYFIQYDVKWLEYLNVNIVGASLLICDIGQTY
jgi:hypothetical protein